MNQNHLQSSNLLVGFSFILVTMILAFVWLRMNLIFENDQFDISNCERRPNKPLSYVSIDNLTRTGRKLFSWHCFNTIYYSCEDELWTLFIVSGPGRFWSEHLNGKPRRHAVNRNHLQYWTSLFCIGDYMILNVWDTETKLMNICLN